MSKERNTGIRFFYSVRLRFALPYIGLIVLLLLILNIYPLKATENLVYSTKEQTLTNQGSIIFSSLSPLETLTEDGVYQVMSLLQDVSLTRIIITDASCKILYDSGDGSSNVGKYALFPELKTALNGYDSFTSKFDRDNAFKSKYSSPIYYRGRLIGALYAYEYDVDQANLILSLRHNLRRLSAFILTVAILVAIILSRVLTMRLQHILDGIKTVADGNYGYKMELKGKDELTDLANEFNILSDRLDKTENMRRQFVSDASHELKTPLSAIRLLSDSIVQNVDIIDRDTVKEFVSDIGEEASRLSRITERLLDLTRLDRSSPSELVPVDVKEVALNALHILQPLADSKNVSLEYRLADGCLILALSDPIYQVIFNLAENGVKYNTEGGKVRVILFSRDDKVILIIDDTGIGIPQEELPLVFDRFYRVDKARSREAGGSGLGLSIVKDSVNKYGGTISVTSSVGKGSSFRIEFPKYSGNAEVKP